MDVTKKFIDHLVYPLMEKRRGNRIRHYLNELKDSQSLPPAQLEQLQRRRLFKLFTHCLRHVPAFRVPETREFLLSRLWGKVPPLTREAFQAHREDYLADTADTTLCISGASSGSTGQRVSFLYDRYTVEHYEAARWRGLSWWDITPSSRSVMIWANPLDLSRGQSLKHRLSERHLKNRKTIPAFDVTPENLSKHVRMINQFKPEYIYGYPSAMFTFAQLMRKSGLMLSHKPKIVLSTSETLYADQRALFTQVFGCPVVNEYGARDAGILAYECPRGKLHCTAENALLEVLHPLTLKPQPIGTPGLLAVTDLHNYVMPRLRYLLGDVAALSDEPCDCGITLPVLASLQGREAGMFQLPDGSLVNEHAFVYFGRNCKSLSQFQLIQHAPDCATLYLVPTPGMPQDDIRVFQERLADILPGVKIKAETVEKIQPPASGKIRYAIREFDLFAPQLVSTTVQEDAP